MHVKKSDKKRWGTSKPGATAVETTGEPGAVYATMAVEPGQGDKQTAKFKMQRANSINGCNEEKEKERSGRRGRATLNVPERQR